MPRDFGVRTTKFFAKNQKDLGLGALQSQNMAGTQSRPAVNQAARAEHGSGIGPGVSLLRSIPHMPDTRFSL